MKKRNILLGVFLSAILILPTSCVHDENNDPVVENNGGVNRTVISKILRINFKRTQIELKNGWTLNLIGTSIARMRASCSGFDHGGLSMISLTDTIEYVYNTRAEGTNNGEKITSPISIKAFRKECLDATQFIEDRDFDGVGDVIDNCPNIPNKDQLDANNNGIGDACE